MTINITFEEIHATTISGGGVFNGQNLALGWNAFTKQVRGISTGPGNFYPITNCLTIVDDRDYSDAQMLDQAVSIAWADTDPIKKNFSSMRKDSEGNNNQLVIQQDGKCVFPAEEGTGPT